MDGIGVFAAAVALALVLLFAVLPALLSEEPRKQMKTRRYDDGNKDAVYYRMGNDFEDYVIGMFDPGRFELIHRTPTHAETGGRFVRSMALPDLRFRDRVSGERFWVEVKYRSRADADGNIMWASPFNIRSYSDAGSRTGEHVFVILGVGGDVHAPENVYCMDLDRIRMYTVLFPGTYRRHRLRMGYVTSTDQLKDCAWAGRRIGDGYMVMGR